jgi:hypothetical protein
VVDAFQKHQFGEMSDKDFTTLLGIELPNQSVSEQIDGVAKVKKWFLRTYLGME